MRKVKGGSSILDILVYLEGCKGRRVFLDFRKNPGDRPVDFSTLSQEARAYLEKAGACFGTPLERLAHMNSPAVDFYRDKGVDLATEPLEIALCAQHNNGGLDIDCWWQTNRKGIFAAGEAAASHGVYRPGGSALNAGQVGSTRAAQYIAAHCADPPAGELDSSVMAQIAEMLELAQSVLEGGAENVQQLWDAATRRMSQFGGPIRNREGISQAAAAVSAVLQDFRETVRVASLGQLHKAFRLRDMLLCQQVYLLAMLDYLSNGGKSRGSALYTDPAGEKPYAGLDDTFAFVLDDGSRGHLVQQAVYTASGCAFSWREVRPIPEDDDFFENVWRAFRKEQQME